MIDLEEYNDSMSSKMLVDYANKWVALTPDRKKVIASARTVEVLDKKVQKLKNADAIYHRVLPSKGSMAPGWQS